MRYPPLLVRSRNGAELHTEHGKVIDFTAGDLFGLASHPHVRAAAHSATERFGVSSISSAARGGYTDIHCAAEALIAEKLIAEDALLFPNRTQAVISLISAGLNLKGGPILIDASVSSPAVDACHLAELESRRVDLNTFFASGGLPPGPALLLLESVSKFGCHIVNLPKLLEKISIPLIADETFAIGVTGLLGTGSFPPPILSNIPLAKIIGFEASLGLPSCAIVGTKSFLRTLSGASKQRAFEAGISPAEAASLVAGFELLETMSAKRDELAIQSAQVIQALRDGGVELGSELPLPFIAVLTPSTKMANEFCAGMLARGVLVDLLGCLTPFSPLCSVRIVLSAAHSAAHLESMCRSVVEVWRRLPKPS